MLEVVVTPRAALQIERASRWWGHNRPSAPSAIADDFEEVKNLLALQPEIGSRSATPRHPNLRRITLERVRYYVFYDVRPGKVVVLAFWHTSRGSGPKL